MSTRKSGVFRVLMTGGIAGLVVSCAPVAVDMMGDAMVDGGQAMMDAGNQMMMDAGRAMVDAGQALRDSGRDARDAADGMTPDADAQVDCATCTRAGAVRTITADTDLDQLVTGVEPIAGATTSEVELVQGPFVLTDASLFPGYGAGFRSTRLWIAPPGECAAVPYGGASVALVVGDGVAANTDTTGVMGQPIRGARIPVRAGEALCASRNTAAGGGWLRWSGFRPYE